MVFGSQFIRMTIHLRMPHGRYDGARVIVDRLFDGSVRKANRWDAIQPANAKRSAVRYILDTGAQHAAELLALWELTHGPSSH